MHRNIDITKLALSRPEEKKLEWIAINEPVPENETRADPISNTLYERGLIELTCTNHFPFEPEGIEIPHNAFRVSDAGKQYLNLIQARRSDRRITTIIAIWGAATGTAALLIDIVKWFL